MLEHGGRLLAAAQAFGRPVDEWLDLSTGISPWAYPVPPLPSDVWQRLPEEEDGLEDAARSYYGSPNLLMLPGSQAAIQTLPRLFPAGRVAMPAPLYSEHPACWRAAGHRLVDWNADADYAVLCNPNNPTGQRYRREELLERARRLRLLVVDEAFIDAEPDESLVGHDAENIVVLRSLGKFFGLAGARVGCAIAAPAVLEKLREAVGPWALSHPARWAARHALADTAWQSTQRQRLRDASQRLNALLLKFGVTQGNPRGTGDTPGTALFRHVATPRADALRDALAQRGILVRHFADPPALRFGLPGDDAQWSRLDSALEEIG